LLHALLRALASILMYAYLINPVLSNELSKASASTSFPSLKSGLQRYGNFLFPTTFLPTFCQKNSLRPLSKSSAFLSLSESGCKDTTLFFLVNTLS